MTDIHLQHPAFHELVNISTGERQLSQTGTAYYGSNWRLGQPLYTVEQMRAAIIADREARRHD